MAGRRVVCYAVLTHVASQLLLNLKTKHIPHVEVFPCGRTTNVVHFEYLYNIQFHICQETAIEKSHYKHLGRCIRRNENKLVYHWKVIFVPMKFCFA